MSACGDVTWEVYRTWLVAKLARPVDAIDVPDVQLSDEKLDAVRKYVEDNNRADTSIYPAHIIILHPALY